MKTTRGGEATDRWELWNLRALFPEAGAGDLRRLRRRIRRISRHEDRALAKLTSRSEELFGAGRRFLACHPELRTGLVVTMHIGPYQFLPEPFLQAGVRPGLLLNEAAFRRLSGRAERLQTVLKVAGQLEWIPIESPFFVRKMITVLRQGRPLIVFLDGNGGLGGSDRTRQRGLDYDLPGRRIKVRTGLGRLIRKLACPVHPTVVRWQEDGSVSWHKEDGLGLTKWDDPEHITRLLYDWGFAEVLATPEQWSYWDMLKESYACFAAGRLHAPQLPPDVREDLGRAFHICQRRAAETVRVELTKEVEVWPGDVLANLSDDCFYTAEGLGNDQLAQLQSEMPPLAELCRRFGREWVDFHVLRLCLLDLARLRGG